MKSVEEIKAAIDNVRAAMFYAKSKGDIEAYQYYRGILDGFNFVRFKDYSFNLERELTQNRHK